VCSYMQRGKHAVYSAGCRGEAGLAKCQVYEVHTGTLPRVPYATTRRTSTRMVRPCLVVRCTCGDPHGCRSGAPLQL
jgi:hypothetical protein